MLAGVHDVIVAGAGPAGSVAAMECARLGLDTVLLEKHGIPRAKCCAGGLLLRAQRRLPVPVPESLVEREINGFAVQVGEHREEFRLPKPVGAVVKRERFDAYLAEKAKEAGSQLIEQSPVSDVVESSSGVEVQTPAGKLNARYLIIAEGATGRLARSIIGPYPTGSLATGVAWDVRCESDPGSSIELHLIDTPTSRVKWNRFPLNGWVFPHRNGANIGVVGQGVGGDRARREVEKIASRLGERVGAVTVERRSAHPLPFAPRRRLLTNRCLVVGDAAGFVNPITGEGMGYAFQGARIAAEVCFAASKEGGSGLKAYSRECEKELLRDLRAAALIGPPLQRLVGVVDTASFFRRFKEDGRLVEVCGGIARGEESWQTLARLALVRFPSLFFGSLERPR